MFYFLADNKNHIKALMIYDTQGHLQLRSHGANDEESAELSDTSACNYWKRLGTKWCKSGEQRRFYTNFFSGE